MGRLLIINLHKEVVFYDYQCSITEEITSDTANLDHVSFRVPRSIYRPLLDDHVN